MWNAGRRIPEGAAAVGWRVGVYWRDDQKFYMGEIAAYNDEDDEYEMNYDDSELLAAPLSSLPAPHHPLSSLSCCCRACVNPFFSSLCCQIVHSRTSPWLLMYSQHHM